MAADSPDLRRVKEFLASRLGSAADAAPLGAGQWSRAYRFRSGGRDLVVRFGVHQEDFAKDRWAGERFAGPELPIPAVSEIGEAFGGYYAVSDRADGNFLEQLDEAGLRGVLPALLRALDTMRQADLSDTSGYGLWDESGSAPHASWRQALLAVGHDDPAHRIHGWRRRLATRPVAERRFDEGRARLADLAGAAPGERHLIHGDLINRNVLVSGSAVEAVLDWGCAAYGDFLYDLAWLHFWAPWHEGLAALDLVAAARDHYHAIGLAVPDLDARLRCCGVHIGLDSQAYLAHLGRWEELEQSARRTMEVARP